MNAFEVDRVCFLVRLSGSYDSAYFDCLLDAANAIRQSGSGRIWRCEPEVFPVEVLPHQWKGVKALPLSDFEQHSGETHTGTLLHRKGRPSIKTAEGGLSQVGPSMWSEVVTPHLSQFETKS